VPPAEVLGESGGLGRFRIVLGWAGAAEGDFRGSQPCPRPIRVEYDAGPQHLTIVEYRPPRRRSESTRFLVTRLRYTPATTTWPLCCRDRHLRFHLSRRADQRIPADSMKAQVSASSRVLDQYRPG
jgi:hypothetical protein